MSDVPHSEMIDRIRRKVEAGVIIIEARFRIRLSAFHDAVLMLDDLIEHERLKEQDWHERNRKRPPQKKRPPGVFARDVPAAQDQPLPAGDIAACEEASPVATDRDSHVGESERRGCGVTSDAAYDRAVRCCEDSGSVCRDGSGVE